MQLKLEQSPSSLSAHETRDTPPPKIKSAHAVRSRVGIDWPISLYISRTRHKAPLTLCDDDDGTSAALPRRGQQKDVRL
jgi:hypothetical protein